MPAFRHKPIIVDAIRTPEDVVLTTPAGNNITVEKGTWIAQYGENVRLFSDDLFRAEFEPVGKEGVKAMVDQSFEDRAYIIPFPGLNDGLEDGLEDASEQPAEL